MRNTLLTRAVALICSSVASAPYSPTWRIRHYHLDYEILPGEGVYRGAATLSLENASTQVQRSVPLAL